MSRNGIMLPVSDEWAQSYRALWRSYEEVGFTRSVWLHDVEAALHARFPGSSTADRALTARTIAPFALRQPGQR